MWLQGWADTLLCGGRLSLEMIDDLKPDLLVSYNYRYIIPESIIRVMKGKAVNLHISLLPWNRGSSPNFWSFIEDSPKGVTIHQLAEGLDTGDIIFQKELYFDEKQETFKSTYEALQREITSLFKENFYNNNWRKMYNASAGRGRVLPYHAGYEGVSKRKEIFLGHEYMGF